MKYIAFFTLWTLFFHLKAQVDMNLSFENWKQVTPPLGSTYEDIDGWWATVNDVRRITGNNDHLTAFKYTPAQQGNYAIRLRSVQALTTFIPGVVVTGSFSFQQQQLQQGKPYTDKPSKLRGYFKYSPVNNDSGVAYIHLSRWNTNLNRRDTIAVDSLVFIGNQTEWKAFELNLDYSNYPGVSPDSIVIRFVSSVNAGFGGGKVGSELIIDNLSLEFPVSKQQSLSSHFDWFPNPFYHQLTLQTQNGLVGYVVEIYDMMGEKVFQENIFYPKQTLDLGFLGSGIYNLLVRDAYQNIIENQKIIKQ
ncbi:MAG: hypothetical protein KatS3mg035_0957 [Bacteroidia bacterium]|nr:MAG: hypothetical protein KatS3mg035_0957 [Bacteroidia bacterium]